MTDLSEAFLAYLKAAKEYQEKYDNDTGYDRGYFLYAEKERLEHREQDFIAELKKRLKEE